MTDLAQEISTDYDHDYDESPDPGDDYLMDPDDFDEDDPEAEIDQLLNCYASVQSYGMNPTAHVILNSTGLFTGTALESMSVSAVLYTGADSEQSLLALESIGSVIKEKMAVWGAKLLTFFHAMSTKVSGTLSTMWEKISTTAKSLINGAWEKAKEAGRTIKAHPYKTILAVVAAAGAVVAVLALVGNANNVTASSTAWESFIARVKDGFSKIRMPGKKVIPDIADGGKLIVDIQNTDGGAVVSGTTSQLGWTKTAVNGILGSLNRVWSGLRNAVTSFGSFINKNGRNLPKAAGDVVAKRTGSNVAGWATQQIINKTIMGWLWVLTGALYKVFSQVFTKAWSMISETFRSLKSDVNKEANA